MNISILIADDHELFRKSLIRIMSDFFPKVVFLEASTGLEVLQKTKSFIPSLIVLDIEMPEKNGLKTLFELRKNNINSKIIILTGKNAKEFVFVAKKYGANGYFTKNISPEMLAEAITRIVSTNLFICCEWFSIDFQNNELFIKDILQKVNSLTNREREVIKYFINGMNTSEVAKYMSVQKKSIDNYKNRVMSKMNLNNDIYFMDWAIKNREILKVII